MHHSWTSGNPNWTSPRFLDWATASTFQPRLAAPLTLLKQNAFRKPVRAGSRATKGLHTHTLLFFLSPNYFILLSEWIFENRLSSLIHKLLEGPVWFTYILAINESISKIVSSWFLIATIDFTPNFGKNVWCVWTFFCVFFFNSSIFSKAENFWTPENH